MADNTAREEFRAQIANNQDSVVFTCTVGQVKELVKDLPINKAIGLDDIPVEFYKYAPINILIWITLFFNEFLTHCFLPKSVMEFWWSRY